MISDVEIIRTNRDPELYTVLYVENGQIDYGCIDLEHKEAQLYYNALQKQMNGKEAQKPVEEQISPEEMEMYLRAFFPDDEGMF